MRGQRIYADVPHARAPARWLDPLLFGSNAALFAAQMAITPTANVVFREPFVRDTESKGPLIYITWHRLNYVCMPMLLTLPPEKRPTIIAHDGVASRAFSHQSASWMGFDVFVFRRRSKVSAREQIADYIRATGRPILNLPDSGGPYGIMKPGILEVARACGAQIVPFQVEAKRSLSVGRALKHVIPLPFSRIDVRRGAALDGTATRDDCQRALDSLA
jgi:lysophospholipid acyltransferase (LPLAT)-like uncharacterized protein